jgi:hypothetical protein
VSDGEKRGNRKAVTPALLINGGIVDIPCTSTGFARKGTKTGTTVGIACHSEVVKGVNGRAEDGGAQGHRDAEAFATYAMSMFHDLPSNASLITRHFTRQGQFI